MYLRTPLTALVISLAATPLLRLAGLRLGLVSKLRADRWNREVIPVLGGAAVFLAFGIALSLDQGAADDRHWGLLAGAVLMFLLGLYDDARELNPPVKLATQIMISLVVVFSGYRTGFFDSEILNILVTVVWLVGITNALNLLDNMDGLAGGISLIAAGFMSFFFWRNGSDPELLVISTALFGGILGFLVYNFPPARIFMGDSGSLFFGFTLASLAIARTPQASNVFAVLGVPALLFLLPILDTALVTVTRLMRGQSPAHGGRDHTSHRLVAFGLSERQTVLVLYGIAVLSGIAGALVESLDYTLSLVLIPVLLVSFAVLAAYLSRLKVVETERHEGPLSHLLQQLTYRRRLFEIALDFFLASIAFYIAVWIRGGFTLDNAGFGRLVDSLPIAIGATYIAFFVLGVYRGLWQHTGLRDVVRLGQAVLASAVLFAVLEGLFLPSAFSLGTVFLFAVFLFVGATAVRSSFRMLDEFAPQREEGLPDGRERVLIYDTGDGSELVLRWLAMDAQRSYRVAGFLDDDEFTWGRVVHEIPVLGGIEDAARILKDQGAAGVIVAPGAGGAEAREQLKKVCEGVWVRVFRAGLE